MSGTLSKVSQSRSATSGDFVFVQENKKEKSKTKANFSQFFVLGRSFWCQNLRLDLLNSEQASEKLSEVRNTFKIDSERYSDFTSHLLKKFKKKQRKSQFLQF